MSKKTVAVFFGGRSPEHDVSIITAIYSVIKPLILADYTPVPVYIAKNGNWFTGNEFADIKNYQSGKIEETIKKQKPVTISVGGGLTIIPEGKIHKAIKIDIAFPAMHGSFGEDGSLMGLLRMANIPFVGSDMEASVVAMNKVLSKEIVEVHGILTPKFLSFTAAEFEANRSKIVKEIITKLRYPLFVKPPHLGSSIGTTKVNNKKQLENAIEVVAYYDDVVLVEEGVNNLVEVTVPIIGNDELVVANVEKTLNTADGVFDFKSKYINGGGKKGGKNHGAADSYSEVPAKLSKSTYDACENIAKEVYRAVGLSGISRIDLLIDGKTKKVYFNEINPLPGSLYVHNWAKMGISNVQLVEKLLKYAEQRFEQQSKISTSFETSYLQQF
jgi:D-alanine-D-alanine ligase